MRYFFDFRDGDHFLQDDLGIECVDLEAAKLEAAEGLAEYARDVVPGSVSREMAVEVRTGSQAVLKTKMVFEIEVVG